MRLYAVPPLVDDPGMAQDTWDSVVPLYVDALRAAHRSEGTIRLHRHYLHHLARFCPQPWAATSAILTRALAVSGWSAETRKSARSVAVGFYRWAHLAGHIEADPSRALPPISVPPGEPRPTPEAVLSRALATAAPRERTMLLLAAYAGLRCAEIARVHADDWSAPMLYVHGKGGKVRVVPVQHPELVQALSRADGYLFPGPNGHLTPGHVTRLLSDALPGQWTGHTLRHRFATRSHQAHPDLLALGKVLGHSRPETTQRYVLLSTDALVAVVAAAA